MGERLVGLDLSLLLDQTEARRVQKNLLFFFNKEYSPFSWQIRKFWLENQMIRTILFAGNFRKYGIYGLWFKAMQFLLYRFNLSPLTDLYAL